MLNDFIRKKIGESLGMQPTKSQYQLIGKLADFLSGTQQEVFVMKGFAGTGKTTIISSLVKYLKTVNQKFVLMAPTGRAAKVLTYYSGEQAYTIHKTIYRQKSSKDGFGVFVLDKNFYKDTIFIVDEASMISNDAYERSVFGSGQLLYDIFDYVFQGRNSKLLLVGDTAQLPPVGLDVSPALNEGDLELFGHNILAFVLKDVLRQSLESGILYNATKLRNSIEKNRQEIQMILESYSDISYLNGGDLLDTLNDAYDKDGLGETIIVTRSNKRANQYNQGIRSKILWREEKISKGDMLMVVKNNYYWSESNKQIDFIANGDIAEIISINGYQSLHGYEFADVTLDFIDYNDGVLDCKIMLDTLDINTAALDAESNKDLFYKIYEDYPEVKRKKQRYEKVRNDPFFNALQVKFSYAVTCHKSQGGQWSNVFIDHGYLTEENINREFLRWLYTAITRARKKVYLVNFKKDFIADFVD